MYRNTLSYLWVPEFKKKLLNFEQVYTIATYEATRLHSW